MILFHIIMRIYTMDGYCLWALPDISNNAPAPNRIRNFKYRLRGITCVETKKLRLYCYQTMLTLFNEVEELSG